MKLNNSDNIGLMLAQSFKIQFILTYSTPSLNELIQGTHNHDNPSIHFSANFPFQCYNCWKEWLHNYKLRLFLLAVLNKLMQDYINLYGDHIDELMQKRCNSSAYALELHLFCINPSIVPAAMTTHIRRIQAFIASPKCTLGNPPGHIKEENLHRQHIAVR